MGGKVNALAVACIILVAAAQVAASGMLGRMRRQAPSLPAPQVPIAAPRPTPPPNLWSCCPRMPTVIKTESKVGCMPNLLPTAALPAMPMTPPVGGPLPVPGGAPMPGGMTMSGGAPMPGGMTIPGGAPVPGGMTMSGGAPMPGGMTIPGGAPVPGGMTMSGGAPVPGAMPVPGGAPPGMTLPRPGGIPPLQRTNNPGSHSCFVECIYKNQNLVSGGVLSTDAVKARVSEMATANPAWSDVLKAAALACTVKAPDVGMNAPCKSGAAEINSCINNYVLKNCPATIRKESDKCTTLRDNVKIPLWG